MYFYAFYYILYTLSSLWSRFWSVTQIFSLSILLLNYFQVHKATGPQLIRNPGSIIPYTIGFSRLKSEEEEKEEKVQLLSDVKEKPKDDNSGNYEIDPKTVDKKAVSTESKPKVSAKVGR